MKKCSKCGTEYEGNFCPNCGTAWQQNKICPNCKTQLPGDFLFCNECGYSFTVTAPTVKTNAVTKTKKQNRMLDWLKSHLKVIIPSVVVLLVAIIVLSLIPTFRIASKNGTYYSYFAYTDELNENTYIKLKTGKWSDSGQNGGNYKVNSDTVTLYEEMFGEEIEMLNATVKNGVFKVNGSATVYVSKKHRHSYGEWKTKSNLSCTTDQSEVRVCNDCGHEDIKVINTATGHKGDWKTTKEATCTESGAKEMLCLTCGKIIKETIEPLEHNFVFESDATSHQSVCSSCKIIQGEKEEHTNPSNCSICGYPYKYKLNSGNNTYSIDGINNNAAVGEINIPTNHNNIIVTSIGDWAFYGCSALTSITIPDGVTSIGKRAFFGCSSLTNITIPDSVTNIGWGAFYGCSALTIISIPVGVTSISDNTFDGCSSLTNITIPDGLTSIGSEAFRGCSSLTSINIPDSVTRIGWEAFYGCSSVESINIPNSVTNIGERAFEGCSLITNITIPDGVTSIEYDTFRNCSSLINVTIPNSVTSIGYEVFRNCSSLTSITFKGTKAQWKSIEKGFAWKFDTGDYTIQCTDGKLDKNGNEIS